MNDYVILNAQQLAEIRHRKLHELEVEHARLELDLRLARATSIENDAVAQAEKQLEILYQQRMILLSWMAPPPAEVVAVPAAANGQGD